MSLNHGDRCWVRATVEHYDVDAAKIKAWALTKFGRQLLILDPKDVMEDPPVAPPA